MTPSHRQRRLALYILLVACCIGAWREWRVRPDGDVTVHILDVGQGDGMFITGPSGQQVVIDGGPDVSMLAGIGRRMSLFDRSIDLLVVTHPDLDHIFALPELVRRYRLGAVLFTGVDHTSQRYQEFLSLLKTQHIPVIVADPTKDIDMGDGMMLDVLWPPPLYMGVPASQGSNNTSIVLRLTYGNDSILFTGDMEYKEEQDVLASGTNIDADILKVAHHGSKTSTSTGFLLAVSPDLALISAGSNNRFGHPHKVITDRLRHFGIPYRNTAVEGTITITLDGQEGIANRP